MNKSLHALIILAFLSLGASNACANDDTVRCSGTVTYEGVSYDVSKNDESEIEAKSELVEVACEEACRGSLLEDSCERACEKSAILSAVTCTHSPRKSSLHRIRTIRRRRLRRRQNRRLRNRSKKRTHRTSLRHRLPRSTPRRCLRARM